MVGPGDRQATDQSFPAAARGPRRRYTASRIDADVERIIESAHGEAAKLLEELEGNLDAVVENLLENEMLDNDEYEQLIGATER